MSKTAYEQGLDKNPANYVPLSPLSFIERTAMVYPTRTSVVHGTHSYTWSETYARCRRLASALVAHGIGKGDRGAWLAAVRGRCWSKMLLVMAKNPWKVTQVEGITAKPADALLILVAPA